MRMVLFLVTPLMISYNAMSQKNNKTERQLYLTQNEITERFLPT